MVGEQAVPSIDLVWAARKRRLSLSVGVAILVLMFLAMGAAFYAVVREGDAPTSTPSLAVEAFLRAVIQERDKAHVQALVCSAWTADQAFAAVARLEDPKAAPPDWDSTAVEAQQDDSHATVVVRIRFAYSGDVAGPSGQARWRFSVVHEKSWRVCDVMEVPQ